MKILSTEFTDTFSTGVSGCVHECQCGITYFHDDENAYDWNDSELENLRKTGVARSEAISGFEFIGGLYIIDCPCTEKLVPFERFLLEEPEKFINYFEKKADARLIAAQRKLDAAKNLKSSLNSVKHKLDIKETPGPRIDLPDISSDTSEPARVTLENLSSRLESQDADLPPDFAYDTDGARIERGTRVIALDINQYAGHALPRLHECNHAHVGTLNQIAYFRVIEGHTYAFLTSTLSYWPVRALRKEDFT